WKRLLMASAFSLGYSFVILDLVMPLNGQENKVALDYAVIGNSTSDAISNLLTNPFKYLKYLWMDSRPGFDRSSLYKREFWIYFLISGGILLFRKPALLLMLIPVFLQKMLNVRTQIWGINDHYAIETLPIISFGIILFFKRIKHVKWSPMAAYLVLFCSVLITSLTLSISAKGPKNEKGQFFTLAHYKCSFNRSDISSAINMIPKDASICATSNILARLSFRDKAFRFPYYENAQYILHIKGSNTYPLKDAEFEQKIESILDSGNWKAIENKAVLILQKVN
ncbi:MAG: DUF2079 domain-containing protein, partial [Bacteroidia bacterium]